MIKKQCTYVYTVLQISYKKNNLLVDTSYVYLSSMYFPPSMTHFSLVLKILFSSTDNQFN